MRLVLVTLALMTLAAAPAPAELRFLEEKALSVERGEGRLNGRDFVVGVVQSTESPATLAAKIERALAGKRSIVRDENGGAIVIHALDVRMPGCPQCTPRDLTTIDAAMREAFAVTITNVPGGSMAMASNVATLAFAAALSTSYEGEALAAVAGGWRIETQISYRFGKASQRSVVAASDDAPQVLAARFASALENAGFRPLGGAPSARDGGLTIGDDNGRTRTYERGHAVVRYQIESDGAGSRFTVNESRAP